MHQNVDCADIRTCCRELEGKIYGKDIGASSIDADIGYLGCEQVVKLERCSSVERLC